MQKSKIIALKWRKFIPSKPEDVPGDTAGRAHGMRFTFDVGGHVVVRIAFLFVGYYYIMLFCQL
jgi:hypothetical protein